MLVKNNPERTEEEIFKNSQYWFTSCFPDNKQEYVAGKFREKIMKLENKEIAH